MDTERANEEKGFKFVLFPKQVAMLLLFLGIIMYAFSAYQINIMTKNAPIWNKIWWELFGIIASTSISVGSLSLLLELATLNSVIERSVNIAYDKISKNILNEGKVKEIVKQSISESCMSCSKNLSEDKLNEIISLNCEGVINNILHLNTKLGNFSKKNLEGLKNNVVIQLLKAEGLNNDVNPNSTIYVLERNLRGLLLGVYYEEHKMTTSITPSTKKNVFSKRTTLEYTTKNPNFVEYLVELRVKLYDSMKDSIKLEKFEVNGKRKNISFRGERLEEGSKYSYEMVVEEALGKEHEYQVYIEYESFIPMYDLTQTFKSRYPCKKFEHQIILSGNEKNDWQLEVTAFNSWYVGKDMKGFRVHSKSANIKNVEFDRWSLPGVGYVISLNKVPESSIQE